MREPGASHGGDAAWLRITEFAAGEPMIGVVATVVVYAMSVWLHRVLGGPALLQPVLVAGALIAGGLLVLGIEYGRYLESARPIHWALGPMIVMLAVPLYRQLGLISAAAGLLGTLLVLGCTVSIASSLVVSWSFDAAPEVVRSLVPRSVTTAVAIGLSDGLGGVPGLTAVTVIGSGLCGALLASPLFRLLRVTDPRVQGFALGIAAHALGTARAFQISQTAGAFASVGMILNALLTALAVSAAIALARGLPT